MRGFFACWSLSLVAVHKLHHITTVRRFSMASSGTSMPNSSSSVITISTIVEAVGLKIDP